jgi:hypothetical protein
MADPAAAGLVPGRSDGMTWWVPPGVDAGPPPDPVLRWWRIQDGGGTARLDVRPVWAGVGLSFFIILF